MINVFVLPHLHVGTFETWNALFEFIHEIENEKLFEDHCDFGNTCWSFSIHSPTKAAALYQARKKSLPSHKIPSAIEEAYTQHLSLAEICAGNFKTPEYITLTPNVDLAALKRTWALQYCAFRNFRVVGKPAIEKEDCMVGSSKGGSR